MKTILAALDDRPNRVKILAQSWASRFPKGFNLSVVGENPIVVSWSFGAAKYVSLAEAALYNDMQIKLANSLLRQFVESEYLATNFTTTGSHLCSYQTAYDRDLKPKRVKVLFSEYSLALIPEVEAVQLPRGTSLDGTDIEIQNLMTTLATMYSSQVLIKFCKAVEFNGREYWGDFPDITKSMINAAIRGDGKDVGDQFYQLVANFDHSELPAFINGVKSIISATDVFKGAVAPVEKKDRVKPMQDARKSKFLNEAIQARDGRVTTVGELIKERVNKGWTITHSEPVDKAESKRLNTELKTLHRVAPIGNKNHPDTIRLNELKKMVNKVWGEIRVLKSATFLESPSGELMVLTPFGQAYAEQLISTKAIRDEPVAEPKPKPMRVRKTRVVEVETPVSSSGLKPVAVKDDLPKFKNRVARLVKKEVPATTLQLQKVRILLKELGMTNIDKTDYDMAEGYYSEHSKLLALTKVGSAKLVANIKSVLANARDFGYNVYKLARNEHCFICETTRDLFILDILVLPWDVAEKEGSYIAVRRIRKPK